MDPDQKLKTHKKIDEWTLLKNNVHLYPTTNAPNDKLHTCKPNMT